MNARTVYCTRPAVAADIGEVLRIEALAAQRFVDVGRAELGGTSALSQALCERFMREGALWVTRAAGHSVAFAACCFLDGLGHVAELDVLPEHAGHRLGAKLIDHAADWARAAGCAALTLCTYRDIPWNAPYYARLGFREVTLSELGPEHAQVWQGQKELGLPMGLRLVMRRELREGGEAP